MLSLGIFTLVYGMPAVHWSWLVAGEVMESMLSRRWMATPILADEQALSVGAIRRRATVSRRVDELAALVAGTLLAATAIRRPTAPAHATRPYRPYRRT